jgi:hypothetical protein
MPEIALNPPPFNPHGEKGESGRPDGWNGRWRAGACQNIYPPAPFSYKGRRGSLGVLMAGTGDGAQGLAKTSTPSPTSRGAYRIIAVLTKIGLVGQGCTRHRTQTPCASSLRVLRVSACIEPAHARRGGAEMGSAVLTNPVGRGCACRCKRAPRATRRSQTGFNVSENCYKFSISISPP